MVKKQVIDFHAHIMPGADHGSKSLENSELQLRILKDAGASAVVATPHFYPQTDSVDTFLLRRNHCAGELSASQESRGICVYAGAEVLVCPGIDRMPGLEKLCIVGTNVILLEMPFSSWNRELIETVYRISRMGLTPVMAHIDRYPMESIKKLSGECNVLYQLNGETQRSFSGKRKADALMSFLPVCAVGSDMHGADKTAAKNLVKLSARLNKKGIDVEVLTGELLKDAKQI